VAASWSAWEGAEGASAATATAEPLLSVRDLEVRFVTRDRTVHAVNGLSFDLDAGQTLGLVGESGSGKSVTSLALLGLLPARTARIPSGEVRFAGSELLGAPESRLRRVRGNDIAMIFQDPMTSLNPILTIGRQLTETLREHLEMDKSEARTAAGDLLARVGIPDPARRLGEYPHQFSGGMRQRVMIAMAIACRPRVLIADEPTTALDVTIQAQILELLRGLVETERMGLLLITHDLGVVAGVCERTAVMYAGRIVETGPTTDLFARPRHPYTLGLLRSVPRLDRGESLPLAPIPGSPRDLEQLPTACAFAPRCFKATDQSHEQLPVLRPVEGERGHEVACWNPVTDAERAEP
jgi:peptide/nickel transport system ATP-binding protein